MTPPSHWRALTRGVVVSARIGNAGQLKGAQMMSDYDILTKWMKYDEDEVKKMLARLKQQKLEDLELQIVAQNPSLVGAGLPGKDDEEQVSTEPSDQNPNLGGMPQPPDGGQPPEDPMGGVPGGPPPQGGGPPPTAPSVTLPSPSEDDIDRYDLEIKDFTREMDEPEIDYSAM